METDQTYLDLLPLPADFTEPTNDIFVLLDALASRIGALRKGGEKDHEAAMAFMTRAFREGKLGRWTFDEMEGGVKIPTKLELDDDRPASSDALIEDDMDSAASPDESNGLDAAVSRAVRFFLATTASAQARMREGKDLSTSQQRKADTRTKNEARVARWKAKGIGATQTRLQSSRQTQRRRKAAR